jgi:cell wall-associated NlpC family hydrolase
MGGSVAAFRPNAALTSGALARLVAGLTHRQAAEVADPSAPVTIAQLDARLVRALGLAGPAASLTGAARAAGMAPPSRFGREVAARLLGLRFNHPASEDNLELRPGDAATRADAAYSAARILGFSGYEVPGVKEAAASIALPPLDVWQRRVLGTAAHFIGYPYVWGGTSESTQKLFGITSRGGFDCSGFVWRVFKLQSYTGGRSLSGVFRGRGAGDMSGEVPRALRIPFAHLEPGDVLFFGAHARKSRPSEVNHTGVYVGGGWMIQSSGQGVALAPLAGWYRQRFAWARRPLSEAGLI